MLNLDKQFDISKDYLLLQNVSMRFGVLICLLWMSEFNNGVKYLLICVDVFSRLVRVQSMKSKYASDAVAAFNKILRKNTKPDGVWVDQGTEFGGEFKKFCKRRDIKIYSTRSETKAAEAERAIRSLKTSFIATWRKTVINTFTKWIVLLTI